MALKDMVFGLCMIAAASPASAATQEPVPEPTLTAGAPAGTRETRYCMRIEAVTGTRIERVKCWTREEWAEQDVDVDKDWAEEGVGTIDG